MIFMGLKYRIQIYAGHAKLLEIRQFLPYTLQISAEIIVIPDVTVFVRTVIGSIFPIISHYPAVRNIFVNPSAFIKTIRKNLIHYTAL